MKIDIDIEKRIVRAFFIKNSQPRLLHELCSKKRRAFTHRLSHQYNKYIMDKCMVDECSKFPSYEQFMDKMLFYGAAKESYVISEDPEFDGIYCALDAAYKKVHEYGLVALIVGLPSGFTHFRAESDASYQPNCFLRPTNRFDNLPWGI